MATAEGKITTARIQSGVRVMVMRLLTDEGPAETLYPAAKKVAKKYPTTPDRHAHEIIGATVESIEFETDHNGRRSRTWRNFHVTLDDGTSGVINNNAPAQTFWLAPSTTEAKEANMPATATATPARRRAGKPAPKNGRKTVAKETTDKATAVKAKATGPKKETAAKATAQTRTRVPVPDGFNSWDEAKLAARVLREKKAGKTINEITEGLGLPKDERHAHKVSLVYRKAADAKGIRTTKRAK